MAHQRASRKQQLLLLALLVVLISLAGAKNWFSKSSDDAIAGDSEVLWYDDMFNLPASGMLLLLLLLVVSPSAAAAHAVR